MVGGRDHSSEQPNSVISPCAEDEEQEPLPTAKFLIAFFLKKTLFFCDDCADNTSPRHSSYHGGDIASRTLEGGDDEWQLPPYAGHSTSAIRRRNATTSATGAVSPSMEEIATRLSAFQEYEQFNSYPSNDAGFLFNLPKSNLSSAQTCFFPNNSTSSSAIPCGDAILGKQEPPQQQNPHPRYHQQTVLSRKGADTSSTYHDNALLVDIASVITPNSRRERVTSFTYVVMCQFVKAAFDQTDRKGNRAKTPLGYVGLKCKYCGGEGMRTGRYFPSSLKTFTDTTKTLLPMYCHLSLCHKCPEDMKSLISRLHDRHEVELKVLKGKKLHGGTTPFYRQIWTSLHADASSRKKDRRRTWS
jgi:hypothetical protein